VLLHRRRLRVRMIDVEVGHQRIAKLWQYLSLPY
jgi:hypothetical protein